MYENYKGRYWLVGRRAAAMLAVSLLSSSSACISATSTDDGAMGSTGGTGTSGGEAVTVSVPAVGGAPLGSAKAAIRAARLRIRVIERESAQPAGSVLRQRPVEDAEVDRRTVVRLTVAVPFPRVPNLIGDDRLTAMFDLMLGGFDARVVRRVSNESVGTVIDQDPAPHEAARSGSTVRLVVAKPGASSSDSPSCHPSYEGACLGFVLDYDCEGGSGDGPYYTGFVYVVGPDVYELDGNDNDGRGCE